MKIPSIYNPQLDKIWEAFKKKIKKLSEEKKLEIKIYIKEFFREQKLKSVVPFKVIFYNLNTSSVKEICSISLSATLVDSFEWKTEEQKAFNFGKVYKEKWSDDSNIFVYEDKFFEDKYKNSNFILNNRGLDLDKFYTLRGIIYNAYLDSVKNNLNLFFYKEFLNFYQEKKVKRFSELIDIRNNIILEKSKKNLDLCETFEFLKEAMW